MSWLFSQVLVEEYSEASYLAGEQSVQSSGKPIPQAYCAPDTMTDFSRLSRFGITFKPFLADRGEDLLTLFREDFHARTLVPQEKAQELMESDQECGEKWRGSFVKFDPDLSLWKTHQCSLLGGLDEFLETWPQWGLMRNGECWEQQTLERRIRGTEFGLSPNGVDSFHTPNTTGLDGGSNSRKALKLRQILPPPPTWPTPTAHMSKECNAPSEHNRNTPTLTAQVNRSMGAGNGGKLNPDWVEWLMGWPLGWTDLKPLATEKSHCAPQQHGES